jgi:hypothetical protein
MLMRKLKFVNSSVFSLAVERELKRSSVVKINGEGVCVFCPSAVWGHVVARKTNNLELNDRQKTRLLSLALEPEPSDPPLDEDEEKGDLLCDVLRCPLPPGEHVPHISKGVSQEFRSVFGPSLGQLLTDPGIDITVLRQIKEYAKALGRTAGSDVEKEVFFAVYFGAIARALTSHGEYITEHADEDLIQFFGTYARAAWMRVDLRELFAKAAEDCESKGQGRASPGC